MKRQLKLILTAGCAVALLALCARSASAKTTATNPPAPAAPAAKAADVPAPLFSDPVIAKGKGFEIKRSELEEVMTGVKSAFAARGQTIPPSRVPQVEAELVNRLIQIQLLVQKATAEDRSNGVQRTDLQISNLMARVGSAEAFERQMKLVGMTLAELRAKTVQEITAQLALTRELSVTVTEAEVKQFYADNPADFERPETIHARHILLMTMDPVTRAPLSADQQKAKQKQAEDLLKRIRGGADFATLAKQYSEDPGSKDNGGELPEFPRGQMVPEFEGAAFSLTNNQVSDVVTSAYGYHIIKLIDKTPAKKMVLADKVPSTDMTIADRVREVLKQQKVEKLAPAYLEKLKADANVQILDADLKAAVAAMAAAAAADTNAPVARPAK
jgi:peptidyl-prolyl cis-trans isomerase C